MNQRRALRQRCRGVEGQLTFTSVSPSSQFNKVWNQSPLIWIKSFKSLPALILKPSGKIQLWLKKEDPETLKTSWRGMKHFQHKPAASHHSLVFPRLVGTENLVALLLKIYLWDILYLLQSAHTVLFCRPSLWRIQLLQSCTSLYGDLEQEWNIWHPPKQLLLHRRNFDAQLTPPASI